MIWELCKTEKAKGYMSALTFANLVYIMRKQLDPETIENIYRKLSIIFTLAPSVGAAILSTYPAHELIEWII